MEADREPIAAVDTAKQRVIDASRECAMAAVGGRFNGSLRAALSSNLFPSATRHHVNQAFKMIMASPAMIAACETAERKRTATIESDEEDERWHEILVAARCAPDDERTEEALFELAEAELLPLADNGSAHAVLSATEMDEWREQLTEVVSDKLLAELAFRWQVTRRHKQLARAAEFDSIRLAPGSAA